MKLFQRKAGGVYLAGPNGTLKLGADGRTFVPVDHSTDLDAAEHHQEVGHDWRVSTDFVCAVAHQARTELVESGPSPANFTFPSLLELVEPARLLHLRRDTGSAVRWNPSWTPLQPDDLGEHLESRDGFHIVVTPADLNAPGPVEKSRMGSADARAATTRALEALHEANVRALASWMVELPQAAKARMRPQRCWQYGAPFPEEAPEPRLRELPEAVADVFESIITGQIERARQFGLGETLWLDPLAPAWVMMPTPDRPAHTLLSVRVGTQTTKTQVRDFLLLVRFSTEPRPDGRGEQVRRVLVLHPGEEEV